MIVELDIMEVALCEWIGTKRYEMNRASNIPISLMGKHNPIKGDIQGFKAEYAFAKRYNLFPDFGLFPRNGSADGITRNGKRYDIKSTHHKKGNLLATTKVNTDIDIYILAVVNDNIVEFVGWAEKAELIKESNLKDLGYGKGYFLSREKLNKF